MKTFTTASLAGVLALASPLTALATQTEKPMVSPTRVTLRGTVDFSAAAASKSNAEAYAALRDAQPRAPLPLRLPNGRETRSVMPSPARLLHTAPNTRVTAEPGLVSIRGFTGIYEGSNAAANGYELEPPDQGLAANAGIVGEIVNNTIQFFRDGQPLTSPLANSTFFNSGTVANLSDPHITFDPSVERWFVDELTYSGPLGYGFFLAVSATSDPTGIWKVYFIPSFSSDLQGCGRAGCLPDYPQVGYDANGFYIDADLFGPKRFVTAAIYAIPKAALVGGTSFTTLRFTLPDFVVQPAVPAPGEPFSLANGGTEFFLTARDIYNGSNKIRLWELQNTFNIATAPNTLVAVKYNFDAEPYSPTVPSTEPDVIGPFGRSQKATSAPKLDGGYNSFGANIKLASGKLYGALTSGAADSNGLPRDIVAWFVLDVKGATPSLAKQGYITPPTGYSISYPDLALRRDGTGYIGVTIANPNRQAVGGFPSTAIIPFDDVNGAGPITVTGVGGTSDDGFTGYGAPHSPGGVGRWGDYGSAVVDAKTGVFYTANEFIPNPNIYPRGVFANWGTFVTAIKQ